MNNLIVFNFESNEVRAFDISGEVWLVASDVASALEYRTASDITRNLDDDEKGTQIVRTLGGNQNLSVINESGLYAAVLKSRKPEAKRFKKWVTSEVIPSIRKTGSYTTPTQASRNLLADKLEAATILADALNLTGSSRNGAFRRTVARLDTDLLPMIPDYAIDAPVVAGQEGAATSEPCYSLTELLKRNNAPFGAVTANRHLIDLGLLEEKERPSRKGTTKKFKCITESGLKYGKNVVSEQSPRETQPQWFESTFDELYAMLIKISDVKDNLLWRL